MTIWFVSRHFGAAEWIERQGIVVDETVTHLDIALVAAGDTVAGTLPINLVADVCERGGRYLHLTLNLAAEERGRELTPDEMDHAGARLIEYRAVRID